MATHSADKQPDSYDFTHAIHEVSFGSKIRAISAKGIGTFNSLGGVERLDGHGLGKYAIFLRFLFYFNCSFTSDKSKLAYGSDLTLRVEYVKQFVKILTKYQGLCKVSEITMGILFT